MNPKLNETHDPRIKSWVESANDPATDFPLQNLPLGSYRRRGSNEQPRIGVAIGSCIFDIAAGSEDGLLKNLSDAATYACKAGSLNNLMALGQPEWTVLRRQLHYLLREGGAGNSNARRTTEKYLSPIAEADLLLPAEIGDYTDFYTSIFHAANVGGMFRPDQPLPPNYKYMPIAYHGRASSIIASGADVRRPVGQSRLDPAQPVLFGPSSQLDYEMEMGFFIGPGNPLGNPLSLHAADERIFGLCIVNDWSARDIQAWEGQPLGPFLAKNFSTTISLWVVTVEALEPFRRPAFRRAEGDPSPLPHLFSRDDQEHGAFDIKVEVSLSSEEMRRQGMEPMHVSTGNMRDLYWTPAQMLAHHASNGCNLRPGDLLASGTISGEAASSQGCLLELTRRGTRPFQLPTGETRTFLEDHDEVVMRASCENGEGLRIGFGECRGMVRPASLPARSG